MNPKQDLVRGIASQLKAYGYNVYISGNREYGFYTDGKRCVSFGSPWRYHVDFSGNYRAETAQGGRRMGTGWQIQKELSAVTEDQAASFVAASAPQWATGGEQFEYTTPDQYLTNYQSSNFTQV